MVISTIKHHQYSILTACSSSTLILIQFVCAQLHYAEVWTKFKLHIHSVDCSVHRYTQSYQTIPIFHPKLYSCNFHNSSSHHDLQHSFWCRISPGFADNRRICMHGVSGWCSNGASRGSGSAAGFLRRRSVPERSTCQRTSLQGPRKCYVQRLSLHGLPHCWFDPQTWTWHNGRRLIVKDLNCMLVGHLFHRVLSRPAPCFNASPLERVWSHIWSFQLPSSISLLYVWTVAKLL